MTKYGKIFQQDSQTLALFITSMWKENNMFENIETTIHIFFQKIGSQKLYKNSKEVIAIIVFLHEKL